MRLSTITLPIILLTLVSLPVAAQNAAKINPKDRAAVSACLKQVSEAYDAYEKLTEKQREKAEQPTEASTCIGAASGLCLEVLKSPTSKSEAACARRELAIWQNYLDRRLKAYLKQASPKESAAMGKVNASWQAYRASRCAYPALDNKNPDDAATLTANCLLTMTGQHALWIDAREN